MRGRWLARRAGRLLTATGDVLFRPGCLQCGASGPPRQAAICLGCWAGVRRAVAATDACPACGAEGCATCPHLPPPWSWMIAALTYDGPARDLILLYKFGPEGGRVRLAGPLAALLAAAVRGHGLHRGVEIVAAVPSHRRRTGERGFDAARVLARRLARRLGLPSPVSLLARVDAGAPRARRRPDRPEDLTPSGPGIFRLRHGARRRLTSRTVLLVDDILTTGTTLRSCAGLLAGAGTRQVRVAVLARTPARSAGSPQTLKRGE